MSKSGVEGKSIIVGCGKANSLDQSCALLHPESSFFSIDINPHSDPDLVWDITQPLPKEHIPDNSCSVIFFENIDETVLTSPKSHALANAARMLTKDGVLVFTGSLLDSVSVQKRGDHAFLATLPLLGFTYGMRLEDSQASEGPLGNQASIHLVLSKTRSKVDLHNYVPLLARTSQNDPTIMGALMGGVELPPIKQLIENLTSRMIAAKSRHQMAFEESRREFPHVFDDQQSMLRASYFREYRQLLENVEAEVGRPAKEYSLEMKTAEPPQGKRRP
jgi:hypothetical protein